MTLLSPRCLECVAGYVKMVKSPRNEKCYNVPEKFQLFNKPPPTHQGFTRDIVFINIRVLSKKKLKIEFLKMCPGCLQKRYVGVELTTNKALYALLRFSAASQNSNDDMINGRIKSLSPFLKAVVF